MAYPNRITSNIVCGEYNTIALSLEGNAFICGIPFKDEPYSLNILTPRISSLNNIKSVSLGLFHVACLDYDGNVFTSGSNSSGQLGIDIDKDRLYNIYLPQKVNLPPCKEVFCGGTFTICLCEDGTMYSFGFNQQGQLGIGNNVQSYCSKQKISSLKDIEFIECGVNHTFCKTTNHNVYCWGDNVLGQLGLGNTDNQNTPILCSSLLNEDVVDIKCGDNHTLVLTSNGDVLSCGDNQSNQLGRNPNDKHSFQKIENLSKIIRIECGSHHSMCIDINKDLYVFGDNYRGQLGVGDNDDRITPIKHPSLSNIIDVSKGGSHTFVKTSKNEIYAFGINEDSQLGVETDNDDEIIPIRVFEDNEDIWFSNIPKSKAKSARSII